MSRWTTMRPALTNVLVVTLVTLLIWMWAAGRTRETTKVDLFVRFIVGDTEPLIAQSAEGIRVQVELQGARRDLDIAEQRLTGTTISLKAGRAGVSAAPGIHAVDLTLALSRTEEIDRAGIAVISTAPTTATLTLLETETLTAAIVPSMPGVQIAGPPTAIPETTKITLPKKLVSSLGADPHVTALVPAAQANALQPGRRHLDITLRVPESLEDDAKLVRMSPEVARVEFMLVSRSSTATLRLVPVQVAGPPLDLAGYDVTIDPADAFLRDVEVSGPSETIRALEDGRAKAFAFVHLSADDLALRVTRKRIDLWMLPPDVTVTRIGESPDPLPVVRLTVKPR